MIRDYWEQMSLREKALISVAGLLVFVLMMSLVLVRPLLNYRSDARQSLQQAEQTLQTVQRAAVAPKTDRSRDPSALRSVLTRAANRNGIVIQRINPGNDAIELSVGEVAPAQLYDWLAYLETDHKIRVLEGIIRPSTDGRTVTGRFTLAPVGG